MSLLSLLIALMAEKHLTSKVWSFDFYYQKYVALFQNKKTLARFRNSTFSYTLFLLVPTGITYFILATVENGLINLIISTLILTVCFGCAMTRASYKKYLLASSNGETITSELHHQQLLQDKNIPPMGFGQALIWLNYRYHIAIMLFFIFFGATGAVFYRLLTTVIEQQKGCSLDDKNINTDTESKITVEEVTDSSLSDKDNNSHQNSVKVISSGCKHYQTILFYLDWLPVRITSFGYMFVGHFSRALPIWIDSLFDIQKPAYMILIDVAEKSEDILLDDDDCTAEPCLLVRLAKRTVLLILAIISILTLTGLFN